MMMKKYPFADNISKPANSEINLVSVYVVRRDLAGLLGTRVKPSKLHLNLKLYRPRNRPKL